MQFCLQNKGFRQMKQSQDMYNIFKNVSCRINRLFYKPALVLNLRARLIYPLNASKGFENAPHFLHPFSCSGDKSARAEWMN